MHPLATKIRTKPRRPVWVQAQRGARSRKNDATTIGDELRDGFAAILETFPPNAQRVSGMSRWLGIDRSVCQRLVLAVRESEDALGVLERLPGVRGLELFLAAARQQAVTSSLLNAAIRSLSRYADLIESLGGSQTRLLSRIELLRSGFPLDGNSRADQPPTPSRLLSLQKQVHEATAGLTRLDSEARVEVLFVRPAPEGHDTIECAGATGLIGVTSGSGSMPILRKVLDPGRLDAAPLWRDAEPGGGLAPNMLLKSFSSHPRPRVTLRREGDLSLQIFTPDDDVVVPIDLVATLGFTRVLPRRQGKDGCTFTIGRGIGIPARRLIVDIYLHIDFPAVRGATAHVIRPSIAGALLEASPESRWFDRIPVDHDVALLAGSPGSRPSAAYSRLGELTRSIADALGWADQPFVGYRLDVEYPMFDMEYVVNFALIPNIPPRLSDGPPRRNRVAE